MANIVTVLDEMTCPAVSGFNMGTWWQKVYTSEAEYRSRYATTLSSIQSGRAVVNSAKSKSVTVSTIVNSLKGKSVTVATLANSVRSKSVTIATLANSMRGKSVTIATLANSMRGKSLTVATMANSLKGKVVTIATMGNSLKGKVVTIATMGNSLKGKSVTIATLANSMRGKHGTILTLANELRDDSTTNAAAVTNLKKWFLNQSYGKARLKIGAVSSAAVQVAATVVNGTINGVWYSMAGAEAAFATPTDSFGPAATRISRCFTVYYTSFATLTHSVGATISGTAVAPIVPRIASNAFPLGVVKIVLKAGTATRFNGGTTTLGDPGLTTTFTDYSVLPDYIGTHADGVSAAAITAVVAAALTSIGAANITQVAAANITQVAAANVTSVAAAALTSVSAAALTSVGAAALTSIGAANVTSIASAAMSTPGASLTSGYALPSLSIDESAISW